VTQDPGTEGPIPSSGTVSFVAAPPAPTVIIKQPEPVRPYTGQSSYKAYREYFERICLCNEWKSPTECARHLLVAMDGAATDAVRGLKAEKDTDLALIWEALSRRFGHVDEPERAMRRLMLGENRTERRSPCLNKICAYCTGRLGLKQTLSRPRPTRFCDGNSWTGELI